MAETNQLSWTPIDKNDNISELIEKINYNFSQFAMYNGGTPGADGADGADGMITKSRCIIHAIPSNSSDDSDSDSDSDYIETKCLSCVIKYFNDSRKNNSEIWLDGDIAIYGPCIFKFNPTVNSYDSAKEASLVNNPFEPISFIKGEKGEKGNDSTSNGYFKLSPETEESSKTLSFYNNDEKVNVQSLILDNYRNIYTTSNDKDKDNANYAPIDWSVEADTVYSLIFPKNNTDGLVFSKITLDDKKEKKRIGDTIIKHTINQYTEYDDAVKEGTALEGVTKSSQFEILDKSTEGSHYASINNMILHSIGRFNKDGNFLNEYKNEIKFNKEEEDNPGINITSLNNIKLDADNIKLDASGTNGNFTINYSGLFEVKTGDETILSIKKDTDSKGNDINVIKISDINSVSSSGSLLISHEGDGEKTETININDKVLLGGKDGDIVLDGTIHNNLTEEDQNYWCIKNNGDATFNSIKGNFGSSGSEKQDISTVFSRLNGGFTQFVDNYYEGNTDEEKKEALRNQIGAISNKELDNKEFKYFTYVPVGTIIMSAIYRHTWITDECGGLYRLCDGGEICIGDTVTPYLNNDKQDEFTIDKLPKCLIGSSTYFIVPDLRGRFIVGAGSAYHKYTYNGKEYIYTHSYNLGEVGGYEEYKLKKENLPRHRHEYAGNEEMQNKKIKDDIDYSFSMRSDTFKKQNSKKAYKAGSDNGNGYIYYTDYDREYGETQSIENRPPYFALTYYIKIQDGVFNSK
jgi:microcystin-dependent protein